MVYSIVADQNGNIWLGTEKGLAKFHIAEEKWEVYNKSNSGLPDNSTGSITIDGKGNIWIASGGLTKLVPKESEGSAGKWTVYNTSNSGLSSNSVKAITIDEDGSKWIGTGTVIIGAKNKVIFIGGGVSVFK